MHTRSKVAKRFTALMVARNLPSATKRYRAPNIAMGHPARSCGSRTWILSAASPVSTRRSAKSRSTRSVRAISPKNDIFIDYASSQLASMPECGIRGARKLSEHPRGLSGLPFTERGFDFVGSTRRHNLLIVFGSGEVAPAYELTVAPNFSLPDRTTTECTAPRKFAPNCTWVPAIGDQPSKPWTWAPPS